MQRKLIVTILFISTFSIGIIPIERSTLEGTVTVFPKLIVIDLDNEYFESIGGFPPSSRMLYLPIIETIKKAKPRVLYLDLVFERNVTSQEKDFAKLLNKGKAIIAPANHSSDKASLNYDKGRKQLGIKVEAIKIGKVDFTCHNVSGLHLPYSDFIEHANRIVLSLSASKPSGEHALFFHSCFDGYVFPHGGMVILNEYLKPHNLAFKFYDNFTGVALDEYGRGEEKVKNPYWTFKPGAGKMLMYEIEMMQIQSFSAKDILSGQVKIPSDALVLVGATADGVAQKSRVGNAYLTSTHILAQEINMLWNIARDAKPTLAR